MTVNPNDRPSLHSHGSAPWDVVVIGAGPAGSLSAHLLARAGTSVLLVDAKPFPREKVCGGCLNAGALAILAQCSLQPVLERTRTVELEQLQLACYGSRSTWDLSGSVVVDRTRFDQEMTEAATAAGACFLPDTTAEVLPMPEQAECSHHGEHRQVQLKRRSETVVVEARIVVCATGLSHSSLRRLPEFTSQVSASSRIGLGAILPDESGNYLPGRLTMAITEAGYVGVTRNAQGCLNVAAAIDADQLSATQQMEAVVGRILESCRLPVPEAVFGAPWHGTPLLTRSSSRVASERLFLLGDAAGYVEPFTGEGIGWALLSAFLVIPLVLEGTGAWYDDMMVVWERSLKRKVLREQWICQLLARILRYPRLAGGLLVLLQHLPPVRRKMLALVSGSKLVPPN